MDIICPRCGEPWDLDSLHDNEEGLPFAEARKVFQSKGCGVVFGGRPCTPVNDERTLIAQELGDLLGDDVDGLASLYSDFGLT